MVAGGAARPELAREVVARMEPWLELCEDAFSRVLRESPLADAVSPRDLAYGAVTFYLGLNLLTHLAPDPRADALFARATAVAPALATLLGPR